MFQVFKAESNNSDNVDYNVNGWISRWIAPRWTDHNDLTQQIMFVASCVCESANQRSCQSSTIVRTVQVSDTFEIASEVSSESKLDHQIWKAWDRANPVPFNRAKLLNVGFYEAERDGFDCFMFHDVDLILEDDRRDLKIECIGWRTTLY